MTGEINELTLGQIPNGEIHDKIIWEILDRILRATFEVITGATHGEVIYYNNGEVIIIIISWIHF